MRNRDLAARGPGRHEALWLPMAIVFVVAMLVSSPGFAEGSNFRVVYADVTGVEELEAGNVERGIRILEAQLRQEDTGNTSDVWATLCAAYIISLSLPEASEACDKAVETGPTFAALNNRGVLRAYKRNLDGAREDFDRARPLQLEAYMQNLLLRDVRLVAADNYRLISDVLARRDAASAPVASRTAEIEDPSQQFRH